jgi:hypothetical protein
MSAHLSRLRLFQRHLRSLVWVWVWGWDWLHSHTPPRTLPFFSPPPFTHHLFPLRSLVCGGQPSPHKPRLVVSHSTCPPLSSSPHANSFVLGTAVINTHTLLVHSAENSEVQNSNSKNVHLTGRNLSPSIRDNLVVDPIDYNRIRPPSSKYDLFAWDCSISFHFLVARDV